MDSTRYPPHVVERVTRNRGRLHAYRDLVAARTALLVVDMQTAFLAEGGPSEVPAARAIVPTINRLARTLRAAGGHVVWVVSTYGPAESDRWRNLFDHVLGPEAGSRFRAALSEGAEGHRIWPALEVRPADPVVSKNRFSGFIGSRGRLERELRGRGIDTLLVAGTVTNVCCESTAREAAMLDFRTIMVSDANAGRAEEDDVRSYAVFLTAFGDVMSADEALALLARGCPAATAG